MDLSQALSIMKKSLNENLFTESKHFKDECRDRNISLEEINKYITKNEILGITQQDPNLYKVWFNYDDNKDLIIIIKILPDQRIRLITLYPCNVERRKRENATKS